MATERFVLGESVTFWWVYRKITDVATDPPTRVAYNPTDPRVAFTKPDGTPLAATLASTPAVIPVTTDAASPDFGYHRILVTMDQVGHWHWVPSDPDPTKPGHTTSHFYVDSDPS